MKKEDLKIEFRAIPYSGSSHVLEYRISPDQDLRYYKEHKLLWGLIQFGTIEKYSTKWVQPVIFRNYCLTCQRSEEDSENYYPIILSRKDSFNEFKTLKTYGDFLELYNAEDKKERESYRIDRNEYLQQVGIWT